MADLAPGAAEPVPLGSAAAPDDDAAQLAVGGPVDPLPPPPSPVYPHILAVGCNRRGRKRISDSTGSGCAREWRR